MNPGYLPPLPVPDTALRITRIETYRPTDLFQGLIFCRIHTDQGLIGCGESYYIPEAVEAVIHDWFRHRLLGADALAIESHWRFLYERAANFGVRGAELRALSAVDLALWDILGQATGQPIHRLLGGPVRERVRVYNSCGHPSYGAGSGRHGWPGMGSIGEPGPLADTWQALHEPAALARELVELGYSALKVWPFDRAAIEGGPGLIGAADIDEAMGPLRAMRDAVGWDLELLVDGHAHFQFPAAMRIAEALREVRPLWLEDILKMDNIAMLAEFRRQSRMPISASEMLLTRPDFAEVLEQRAADYLMIDPTWVGGISEARRIADMAQAYNLPVSTHDCTGPLTLYAGIHLNAALPNCILQETVRAHIHTVYPKLVDEVPEVAGGHVALPARPGLGTCLNEEFFDPRRAWYRASSP